MRGFSAFPNAKKTLLYRGSRSLSVLALSARISYVHVQAFAHGRLIVANNLFLPSPSRNTIPQQT